MGANNYGFPSQGTSPEIYTNPNTPQPKGMIAPGNTDLSKLPVVGNPDGSYSTVYSTGIQDENPKSPYYGKQVLLRGILNGKQTNDRQALAREYYRTGKHLGVFDSGDASTAYGIQLHNDWAAGNIPGVAVNGPPDTMTPPKLSPQLASIIQALVTRK